MIVRRRKSRTPSPFFFFIERRGQTHIWSGMFGPLLWIYRCHRFQLLHWDCPIVNVEPWVVDEEVARGRARQQASHWVQENANFLASSSQHFPFWSPTAVTSRSFLTTSRDYLGDLAFWPSKKRPSAASETILTTHNKLSGVFVAAPRVQLVGKLSGTLV